MFLEGIDAVWSETSAKASSFTSVPGQETYLVYKEELPLKIIEDAARWLGAD
jgi:hypothetical protein